MFSGPNDHFERHRRAMEESMNAVFGGLGGLREGSSRDPSRPAPTHHDHHTRHPRIPPPSPVRIEEIPVDPQRPPTGGQGRTSFPDEGHPTHPRPPGGPGPARGRERERHRDHPAPPRDDGRRGGDVDLFRQMGFPSVFGDMHRSLGMGMMFPSGMDFPRDMMTDMHTSLMDLDPHDDHFRAHDRHLSSHPNRGGGNPPHTYMHTKSYCFVRGPDGKTVEHAQTTRRAPGVLERERYVRDGVRREETAEHQRALGSI